MKSLILLIVLIGLGFNSISQNFTITAEQLKQIRLLENRASRDSSLLIEKNIEIDTLNSLITTQKHSISLAGNEIAAYKTIITSKDTIVSNKLEIIEIWKGKYNEKKQKVTIRTGLLIASGILNLVFVFKSLN